MMKPFLGGSLLWLALAFGVARADWLRAESPNFVLHTKESESRACGHLNQFEQFDRLLRLVSNVDEPPAPSKLHV